MRSFLLAKDFVAGLFFVLLSCAAMYFSLKLERGPLSRMGPGDFPLILEGCLFVVGLIIAGRSLATRDDVMDQWAIRPMLLVLGAFGIFGLLVERTGLIVAGAAMIAVATCAAPDRRWLESAIFGALLIAGCALLFPYALGLQIRLWPW